MSEEQPSRRDPFYFTPEEIRTSAEAAIKVAHQRRLKRHMIAPKKTAPVEVEQPESKPDNGMSVLIDLIYAINNAPVSILERTKILLEALEMYVQKPDLNGAPQQVLEEFYVRPFIPALVPFVDALTELGEGDSVKKARKREKHLQVISAIKTLLALQEFSRSRHK